MKNPLLNRANFFSNSPSYKKFLFILIPTIFIIVIISSCLVKKTCIIAHDWEKATCISPKICRKCGKTNGKKLGHEFKEATCEFPETCERCGLEKGDTLPHNFLNGHCVNCFCEDENYMNMSNYGFLQNNNMTKWVKIYEYSLGDDAYVKTYENPRVLLFKNNALYYYHMADTKFYNFSECRIINNDAVSLDRGLTGEIVITERVIDENNHLIIKTNAKTAGDYSDYEQWFILYDQIDWSKPPETVTKKKDIGDSTIECNLFYLKQ